MIDKKDFEEVLKDLPIDKKQIADTILDDLIFIENNLIVLRTKPFIKYHPEFPTLSKSTPEAKLYKELVSQKNNLIRTLNNTLRSGLMPDEENPLESFNKLFNEKFGGSQ